MGNDTLSSSNERECEEVIDLNSALGNDARSQQNSAPCCCATRKRLLGVDFGHARIGLSLSDPLQIIASPLPSIQGSKNPSVAARFVADEIKRRQLDIGLIVVGLPIHLNGSESGALDRGAVVCSDARAADVH